MGTLDPTGAGAGWAPGEEMDEGEADQVNGYDEVAEVDPEEHVRLARLHAAGLLSDDEFDSALRRRRASLPHRQS